MIAFIFWVSFLVGDRWATLAALAALPIGALGMRLRMRGRREGARIERWRAARRRVADIVAGPVALCGRWRGLTPTSGLVSDEGASALVLRLPGAAALADGAEVLVIGCATGEVDRPDGAGYREAARVWLVDARGQDYLVSDDVSALERTLGRARVAALAGAALFALAVLLMVGAAAFMRRALYGGLVG